MKLASAIDSFEVMLTNAACKVLDCVELLKFTIDVMDCSAWTGQTCGSWTTSTLLPEPAQEA